MIKKLSVFSFLILFTMSSFWSCGDDEPRLTRSHRKLVDSLVQDRRTAIREELDSLCDLRFATEVDIKTDSIVKERVAEIRKKIEADAR